MKLSSFLVLAKLCLAEFVTVQTPSGPIQGIATDSYHLFQGIPYAEPPVGELRFASPVPISPWSQALNATTAPPGCPQNCILPPHTCPETTSEDCLYLNIWTPPNLATTASLPVMFFIPGGRFEQGAGDSLLYWGARLVSYDVVYVNINYRLGALGYLYTDQLPGNFGIRDQQVALAWVKDNIAAFGGDPDNVLLYGQSAGGASTAVHLTTPSSYGLYAKAIVESDPGALPIQVPGAAVEIGDRFSLDLGCSLGDVACLRAASIPQILAAQTAAQNHFNFPHHLLDIFMPFTPVVDGQFLPLTPLEAFSAGKFNPVPVMMGTVGAEAWLFIYQADTNTSVTTLEYEGLLTAIFQKEMPVVSAMYPPPGGDCRPTMATLGTEYLFTCPTRLAVRAFAPVAPAFLYQFTHVMSFDPWGPLYPYCVGVCCHGSELPFIYDSAAAYFNITAAEQILTEQMEIYWTNFAKTGDPNQPVPADVFWPTWNDTARVSMTLATPNTPTENLLGPHCDTWDQLGYTWGS